MYMCTYIYIYLHTYMYICIYLPIYLSIYINGEENRTETRNFGELKHLEFWGKNISQNYHFWKLVRTCHFPIQTVQWVFYTLYSWWNSQSSRGPWFPPLFPFSALFFCSSPTGHLAFPWTPQVYSCLRDIVFAFSPTWNAFVPNSQDGSFSQIIYIYINCHLLRSLFNNNFLSLCKQAFRSSIDDEN